MPDEDKEAWIVRRFAFGRPGGPVQGLNWLNENEVEVAGEPIAVIASKSLVEVWTKVKVKAKAEAEAKQM